MQEAITYSPTLRAISYNEGMEDVRALIVEKAAEQGVTLADLSRGAGKNHAYFQQFVKRGIPAKLPEEVRLYLSDRLGIPEAALGAPNWQTRSRPNPASLNRVTAIPGKELVGALDFNVFAAAQGGDGHLIITFDPVDRVKRPVPLETVPDSYGILITGESMSPVFEPGDIALVHPRLPAMSNTDVVLYHTPPAGEAEAIIKRLIGATQREWHLRQYNPPEDFNETKSDWPICHRVVGKYSRR